MTLTTEDRLAIIEVIAMHGHLVDAGDLDGLDRLFTADVVYDVSDLGFGALVGVRAIREAALALGAGNPVGHHVTNTVVSERNGMVIARSKAIAVNADGTTGSAVYEDILRRDNGWRISHRRVSARRAPLGG